jgi:hypothetical protein
MLNVLHHMYLFIMHYFIAHLSCTIFAILLDMLFLITALQAIITLFKKHDICFLIRLFFTLFL